MKHLTLYGPREISKELPLRTIDLLTSRCSPLLTWLALWSPLTAVTATATAATGESALLVASLCCAAATSFGIWTLLVVIRPARDIARINREVQRIRDLLNEQLAAVACDDLLGAIENGLHRN